MTSFTAMESTLQLEAVVDARHDATRRTRGGARIAHTTILSRQISMPGDMSGDVNVHRNGQRNHTGWKEPVTVRCRADRSPEIKCML